MSPKIELIPCKSDFAELFYRWRAQPSSVRHNPLKATTLEKVTAMLSREGSDLSDLIRLESYRWFISYGTEVVGSVGLKNINSMMAFAEVGYGVSEEFQGRGIATQAVGLMVDKIFKETQLRKLIAYVHDKNTPSCRVLEKLGFQREGLLREHYIINGKPENEVLYAILRSEYRAKR